MAEDGYFVDVTAEAGLDFVHFNGMSGELYFVEMMGPGGALFDYDGDGDLDVFIVQGTPLDDKTTAPRSPGDRLYRNDLVRRADGTNAPRFVDVTARSGIREDGYGMGAATGDFDNDGWTDLYVLNFGANQLLRNLGDGKFGDVTAASGAGDQRWSIGASAVDYDRDGWLDVYVVNYVDFDVADNVTCYAASSRRDYCGPDAFPAVADLLLRNLGASGVPAGEIRFEDVSLASGIARRVGPGLGVVAADFNDDGWTDFYVANDGKPNFLWISRRQADGSVGFSDESLLAGVAVNREGRPEASMGVAAGDFDNDGDEDLFLTHLTGETNTLYANAGGGLFEDETAALGLGPASLGSTSFGTGWLDVDNDGWLDLLVVNGAVKILESRVHEGDDYPLDQPNQLFRNRGGGRSGFEDATAAAGPAFALAAVSRGAAFGDVDNDGDTDALVFDNAAGPHLLLNRAGQDRPWMGWRLLGASGRDALGARLVVQRPGGGGALRRAATDGGFSSANDPRVLFGLGGGDASEVRVVWPGGGEQRLRTPAKGRYTTLRSRN